MGTTPKNVTEFILNGGCTKRFHTVPTIREHTVGQHAYGVAGLVWLLTQGEASAQLLMAALMHDAPEQIYGDVPSPAKKGSPVLKCAMDSLENDLMANYDLLFSLEEHELRVLKLADLYEGLWSCMQEYKMGNRIMIEPLNNFSEYIRLMSPQPGPEMDVWLTILHGGINERIALDLGAAL